MQPKVIITCAVTGAGDTVGKHPAIPVTPEQIASSALEAASAGATVVHCHVREPSTGKGSRKVAYYREVMERIRDKNKEVIINLTAGMGGDVEIGSGAKPLDFGPGTDCVGPRSGSCMSRNSARSSVPWTVARSTSATATASSCRRRRNCASRPSSSCPTA